MIRQFINRETELNILNNEWTKDNSFVVIYGKRRVGKTELIKQFTQDKPALIYIFPEASKQIQINELKNTIATYFNDDILPHIEISDWYVLFDYLSRLVKDKTCIVFDEFTYGIKSDRKILSDLQRVYDTKLKDKELMIIVSGSLLGMVHEDILNNTSPLYGRRTRDLLVEDLEFWHAKKFFNIDFEEFIRFYFAIGGVPLYWMVSKTYNNFNHFVDSEFLNKKGYFYREVYFILSQELRDIKTYFSILQALASGNTKPTEIANTIGKDTREIYPYLENLIRLNYARKETPPVGKGTGVYCLNDYLFDFWFNTVYKYRSHIELDNNFNVNKMDTGGIDHHFGRKFEDISKQFLIRRKPFNFTKISRQWGRIRNAPPGKNTYEIDLLALNEQTGEIGFFECKWQDISYEKALKLIDNLKQKSKHVDWNHGARKEHFGIIAKKLGGKERLRQQKNVCAFDLDDFSHIE